MRKTKVNIMLLTILLLLPGMRVWAFCTPTGSFSVNTGNITVQRDVAVGQPISGWLVSNGGQAYNNCNYDATPQYPIVSGIKSNNQHSSGLRYNGETVFDTNVPGVGFVIEALTSFGSNPLTGTWQGISAGNTQTSLAATSHDVGNHLSINDQARIMLIKTETITPGSLGGEIARFFAGTRENAQWSQEIPIMLSGGAINTVACTVTTPNVDVPLGDHDKNEFSGTGATTSWQAFNIGLQCDKSARINVRIDPSAGAVSGMTDVMKLDDAGGGTTASGIGVQLWFRPNGGSAVNFGQETYYWTSGYGGNETVQLQARYYQTAQNITPGSANATATFTLSYK